MKLTFSRSFSLVRTPQPNGNDVLHVVSIYERYGLKSIDFGGYSLNDESTILRDNYETLKSAQADCVSLFEIEGILSS
jgi:hypothetical protein